MDPYLVRVRIRELRPQERATAKRVAEAQDLAPLQRDIGRTRLSPRPARSAPSIWAVGMIRDDDDIIGPAVRHMVSQGVDRVLIAANLCSDGTWGLLRDLAADYPVTVVRDDLEGYYQAAKMTRLARAAAAAGADWIVPFDADELWFGDDRRLRDALVSARTPIVRARLWNYLPSRQDDPSEPDPTRRIQWRESMPAGKTKVAFRSHPKARLRMGNHGVTRPGSATGGLEIAHFPYRTEDQFVTKLRRGRVVLASTDLPSDKGRHWRQLGGEDVDLLRARWQGMVDGAGLSGDAWVTGAPLVHDPVAAKRVWASPQRASDAGRR